MCDGPIHQTRRQSIVFGARSGDLDLTVYGPRMELHSGHYGGIGRPIPPDARAVVDLDEGRERACWSSTFTDDIDPLTDLERRAIAAAPDIDRQLARDFWPGSTDGAPRTLTELITLPL